jgi:serine protease
MPTARLIASCAAVALLALPGAAEAADYVRGEVIVKYRDGTTAAHQSSVERQTGTDAVEALPSGSEQLAIEDGESVARTVAELRDDPGVAYAVPNHVAHAAQFAPDDPAFRLQWNFFEEFGIGMPEAWSHAAAAGAPGGRGAIVAVLDSGVAFERFKRFRRAPDLRAKTFLRGYDFVERDRHPNDAYGHGTHVTGTIAQATNNDLGTAGIAYGAKVMPLKVLNNLGEGDSVAIAKAIRYAARHRADVINLSLEFDPSVVAGEIPEILSAVRYAHRRGTVIVAAAGNKFVRRVAYPARATQVIAVGAVTRHGCQTDYSNSGNDLDIVAPGGGVDAENADNPWDLAHCHPEDASGDSIFQQTFRGGGVRRFGFPPGYEGTSMASPHVAGIAALVIATRKLGANPTPREVQNHLQATARDLGAPGVDGRYGWGLVDAARALRCPPYTPC